MGDAGEVRVQAEGWYRDPYLVHEDRWFSSGEPTTLVRDNGIEHYDPPPAGPPETELAEVPHTQPTDGSDLRRADEDGAWDDGDGSMWKALWWAGSFGVPELDVVHGLMERLRRRERG